MALPNLPEDVIQTKILPLLPIKSLMRFRSVCKSWKSLFFESGFINSHHNYCTSQNPDNDDQHLIINRLVPGSHKRKYYDIDACHNYNNIAMLSLSDLSKTELFDVPRSQRSTKARMNLLSSLIHLLGSINGLVCLYVTKLGYFLLWNPATRQAKKFKRPQWYNVGCWRDGDFFGFCWNELENDFQVVVCYTDRCFHEFKIFSSHVYSCNSGSWSSKFIKLPGFKHRPRTDSKVPSAIVNGVPYWNFSFCSRKPSVIKFEVQSKEFRELPAFKYGVERGQNEFLNVSWKGSLAVLTSTRSQDFCVNVYIFDERNGIWSKTFIVGPVRTRVDKLSACFKRGGEIVFHTHEEYMCYDHKTEQIERLGNQEGRLLGGFSYKATLVFLKGMKPLHKVQPLFWN
ncbi:F-box/kelch-repeat protein At3g23880-like [Apium graveolens]|uniref:F-box/kelch-repeat protein At3g23880-like n=1 Tax=Apium graveolens TaxID=4045 RepID=UPI003D78E837